MYGRVSGWSVGVFCEVEEYGVEAELEGVVYVPVSYIHLTLPTNREVLKMGVADVSIKITTIQQPLPQIQTTQTTTTKANHNHNHKNQNRPPTTTNNTNTRVPCCP